MPKSGRKAGGKGGDSCFVPFHTFQTTPLVGGVFSVFLSPNATISPRSLIEADAWAHFRVKSYAFRIHPSGSTVTNPQAVGYVGGVQDTVPNTVAGIMELLPSTVMVQDTSVPTEWIRPSKSELSGPLPWYKTIPGTADPTEEAPGAVCVSGGATDIVFIEHRGVFEFKTAVATGNTPMAVAAIRQLREERIRSVLQSERDALLKILAAPPASTSVTGAPRMG